MLCLLTQIQLKEPNNSETGWDNHKKVVKWLENTDDSKALRYVFFYLTPLEVVFDGPGN